MDLLMELYSGQNCQEVIRVKLSFWFNDIRFNLRICNVGNVAYLILTDMIVVFFTVNWTAISFKFCNSRSSLMTYVLIDAFVMLRTSS